MGLRIQYQEDEFFSVAEGLGGIGAGVVMGGVWFGGRCVTMDCDLGGRGRLR